MHALIRTFGSLIATTWLFASALTIMGVDLA
jgi:hypothetical protein